MCRQRGFCFLPSKEEDGGRGGRGGGSGGSKMTALPEKTFTKIYMYDILIDNVFINK